MIVFLAQESTAVNVNEILFIEMCVDTFGDDYDDAIDTVYYLIHFKDGQDMAIGETAYEQLKEALKSLNMILKSE